jgi:hypothetical protein
MQESCPLLVSYAHTVCSDIVQHSMLHSTPYCKRTLKSSAALTWSQQRMSASRPPTTSPLTGVAAEPGLVLKPVGQLTALPHVAVLAYRGSQQAAAPWVAVKLVMLMLSGLGEVLRLEPLTQGKADATGAPGLMSAQVAPSLNTSVQVPS